MTDKEPRTALEDQIVDNLRRAFRQRAEEALPDRFQSLLQQLRDQEEDQRQGHVQT